MLVEHNKLKLWLENVCKKEMLKHEKSVVFDVEMCLLLELVGGYSLVWIKFSLNSNVIS